LIRNKRINEWKWLCRFAFEIPTGRLPDQLSIKTSRMFVTKEKK
jgi:hypothetical protein